ncbi:hypothetical protein [Mesorhizobium sp. CA5]|uniref:hypothetical protein n=1 Tax=Mesorhizobium sp. CA5 TaxID=2876638 RepID=UPI001CD0D63E|nr:hypothetical protein [Mesorhizobium sp. CA5]MBZ9843357.1 hypothetical protein [Mesorhizobium sp. CA5]
MKRLATALVTSLITISSVSAGPGTVTAVNDDNADLYVSVWDLNTADQKQIWDRQRLNDSKQLPLTVEIDGNGQARIKWTSVRTAPSDKPKTKDGIAVNENDNFYVDTRQ